MRPTQRPDCCGRPKESEDDTSDSSCEKSHAYWAGEQLELRNLAFDRASALRFTQRRMHGRIVLQLTRKVREILAAASNALHHPAIQALGLALANDSLELLGEACLKGGALSIEQSFECLTKVHQDAPAVSNL
jgi:hypothetical protein